MITPQKMKDFVLKHLVGTTTWLLGTCAALYITRDFMDRLFTSVWEAASASFFPNWSVVVLVGCSSGGSAAFIYWRMSKRLQQADDAFASIETTLRAAHEKIGELEESLDVTEGERKKAFLSAHSSNNHIDVLNSQIDQLQQTVSQREMRLNEAFVDVKQLKDELEKQREVTADIRAELESRNAALRNVAETGRAARSEFELKLSTVRRESEINAESARSALDELAQCKEAREELSQRLEELQREKQPKVEMPNINGYEQAVLSAMLVIERRDLHASILPIQQYSGMSDIQCRLALIKLVERGLIKPGRKQQAGGNNFGEEWVFTSNGRRVAEALDN